MNTKNTAVKRINADVKEIEKHPSWRYHAAPLEDDIFEWHFTIRGTRLTASLAHSLTIKTLINSRLSHVRTHALTHSRTHALAHQKIWLHQVQEAGGVRKEPDNGQAGDLTN